MDKLYDHDIREDLYDFMDEHFGKNRTFDEKIIAKSRADIIMITTTEIIGFEIKSDKDTYTRLKSQIKDYNKFCDRNYIVIGKSHEKHASEHVPKFWGIIVASLVDNHIILELQREAQSSPRTNYKLQFSFVWRPELNHLLAMNKLPKYTGKSKVFVIEKLLEKVDFDTLKSQVCEELFERDFTKAEELFEGSSRSRKNIKAYKKYRTVKR